MWVVPPFITYSTPLSFIYITKLQVQSSVRAIMIPAATLDRC